MGMEVCCTLGMIEKQQALELKKAGLTAYNHNLDTSREYYPNVITTRSYDERLETLEHVREAGINVCSGGIIGLGEVEEDRVGLLHTLATLPSHPESVPINALLAVKGTPLEDQKMRKRFKLPGYNFCCGRPAIADCTLWLFCCWCSLAQEVRTANSYEIVEDKFCKRREENSKIDEAVVSSLPREDGVFDPSCSPKKMTTAIASSSLSPSRQKYETCLGDKSDEALSPPSPPFIHREAS
ncbi:unnamed protein product [Arabidopsis arenosa]|uniref:Radical SAM core domain-containing protein n=1 Tax=Arabidopsis arenosa TaxID=38785 RepID=A0A8S2AJY1_ARAAE|nr:unnamed protein product [Arabidopsis arenosa]